MTIMADDDRVLTFADLREKKRWPYSRVHTRRLYLAGKFPKPFKASGEGGYNLWLESEVDAYLAGRAKGARGGD
jgi:predicted DNA-binding transcriptional regulator AlpA